jgi:formate dehydrogenase alpha subunit
MNCDFVLTVCPFCGCGCQLYLEVMDGELMGVLPCKTDEMSEGKPCIKGRNAADFISHPDRLKSPLVKRKGKFELTSWKEALDIVSSQLSKIKEKHGPDSVGVLSSAKCTNEENFLLMKFARAVIGTNNVDHCARLCHASTVVGLVKAFGSGAMTNSVPEIEGTDCIFVIGSNTMEQHPLISLRVLRAKERGAPLIVADPRRTPLVDFADIYLQHRPGTDVALINGLMHVIVRDGLEDKKFIRERTEGFEELEKKIKEYPPEKVSRVTGVDAATLEKAARFYGEAEKASILYAMGITQHTTGTENVLSVANLAMLTGNVGRESTGVNPLRGQNNVQGACDMGALPDVYSGYQRVNDKEARARFEKAWGVGLPQKPGLTVTEMTDAAINGSLKAMYIMGENPALSDPDINHLKKALSSLDFLVVQDIFLSEAAQFAHVVLPACSFAEKEGTFTATDRRVQRVRKAIEPIGDSKPDWIIVSELARRMGGTQFNYTSPGEIMKEIASLTPSYAGISHERLDNGKVLAWPCLSAEHPGTRFLHSNAFTRGRGQFFAIDYKEPAELPDKEYPFLLTTGRLMFQYHTGTMTRRIPALERELPTGFIEINRKDAKKLSISQGERIRVKSRRGEIEIQAFITDGILPGVVFIPFHFAECAANVLTSRNVDPEAKIPEFKVCAVKIYKDDKHG